MILLFMDPVFTSTEASVAPLRPTPWWPWLRMLPFAGCAALVAYLQFRADPSLPAVPTHLAGVRDYFDIHDFAKNAFGFGVLAVTAHFAFDGGGPYRVGRSTAVLAGVIVLLELAQLPLPSRTCDWRDVAAGWLGIGLVDVAWRRGRRLWHDS